MRWDLDESSPVPLYRQIVDQVRHFIAVGALRPGDRVPTVREIAVRARVNRNTAARAIQELEGLGMVRTRVGQGTFVQDGAGRADPRRRAAVLDGPIDRLLEEARVLGLSFDELKDRLERRMDAFDGRANRPRARVDRGGEP